MSTTKELKAFMIKRSKAAVSASLLMIALAFCQPTICEAQSGAQKSLTIEAVENAIEVKIGDEIFTRYVTNDETKPTFFPVYGPGQVPMTRSFPLAKVEGEANDHPHHKSVWLGHEINGLDFWANRDGVIKLEEVVEVDQESSSFRVITSWNRRDNDEVVCTVESKFVFGFDESVRWIDAVITFVATDGDVTFNDTKEGMFAIRTHPELRLTPVADGGNTGSAMNSQGVEGKAVWGKSAQWVNYWGRIEGRAAGVAMFDHPDNFRHPTHWHARDYGLVAANPFGLHHFTGAEKGKGEHTIAAGESMVFRYRLLFHQGISKAEDVEARFQAFATK